MTDQGSPFDTKAADWDKKKTRVALAGAIAEAISDLPLNREMSAMEYGCGTGLVGLALAPRLGKLTAVDTSPGMLEVLQQKIDTAGVHNVTPLQLDLAHEPCVDRFDLIFSAMTLHHIEAANDILAVFCRLLNDGGYLAIADLDREDGSFHAPGSRGVRHHGFDRRQLSRQLGEHGLTEVKDRTAYVFRKSGKDGTIRDYSIFLITGRKAKE